MTATGSTFEGQVQAVLSGRSVAPLEIFCCSPLLHLCTFVPAHTFFLSHVKLYGVLGPYGSSLAGSQYTAEIKRLPEHRRWSPWQYSCAEYGAWSWQVDPNDLRWGGVRAGEASRALHSCRSPWFWQLHYGLGGAVPPRQVRCSTSESGTWSQPLFLMLLSLPSQ